MFGIAVLPTSPEFGFLVIIASFAFLVQAIHDYSKFKSPFGLFGSPPTEFIVYFEYIDRMDWERFEDFIAHLFRNLGYCNVEVKDRVSDRGIDVVGYNPRSGEKFTAECKKWTSGGVGEPEIRKFVSVADYTYNAKEKWFFTTSYFTGSALDFAKRARIKLVEMEDKNGRHNLRTFGLIDLCMKVFVQEKDEK